MNENNNSNILRTASAFKYPLASKYSTNTIVSKAFMDYTGKALSCFQDVLNALVSVEDKVDSNSDVSALVSDVLQNDINSSNVTGETLVIVGENIFTLENVLTGVANAEKEQLQKIDDSDLSDYNFEVSLFDVKGNEVALNIESLNSKINDAYHSIVTHFSAAKSYTLGNDAKSRLQVFRDSVASFFDSAFSDFSGIMNYSVDLITAHDHPGEFIADSMEKMGITGAVEENEPFINSPEGHYTGTTPAIAYTAAYVGNEVIEGVVNVYNKIGQVVDTTMNSLIDAGEYLINKADEVITELYENPYDVKLINEKGNHTFKDFYIHKLYESNDPNSLLLEKLLDGPIHFDFFPCEIVIQLRSGGRPRLYTDITTAFTQVVLAKLHMPLDVSNGLLEGLNALYQGTEVSFNTLKEASEYLSEESTDDILGDLNAYYLNEIYSWTVNVLIKPKPLRSENFENFFADHDLGDKITIADGNELLSYMCNSTSLYGSVDEDEVTLYTNLYYGLVCSLILVEVLGAEANGSDVDHDSTYIMLPASRHDVILNIPETINNLHWFNAVTLGMIANAGAGNDYVFDINGPLVCRMFENVLNYQHENPYDYSFYPYTRNAVGWFTSSFRISTDEDNQAAIDSFVLTAVKIISAIVIVFFGIRKLKFMSNRASLELAGAEWTATEAASNGVLTNAMVKNYLKTRRKANILSLLSGNLISGLHKAGSNSNLFSNFDNVGVDLTPVIHLITGE